MRLRNGLGLVLASALALSVAGCGAEDRSVADFMKQIELNMSRDDVIERIGEPDEEHVDQSEDNRLDEYEATDAIFTVFYEGDVVHDFGGTDVVIEQVEP